MSGMHDTPDKIRIGVSSCLLGYDVRYDGTNKMHSNVLKLAATFDILAICPEYGIGMGVPRAPINIVSVDSQFRARGVADSSFDVTDSLVQMADRIFRTHKNLGGYVFKARSPSCGLGSTPWFDHEGQQQGVTSGVFTNRIQQLNSELPMIEETQLENENEVLDFIARVIEYAKR